MAEDLKQKKDWTCSLCIGKDEDGNRTKKTFASKEKRNQHFVGSGNVDHQLIALFLYNTNTTENIKYDFGSKENMKLNQLREERLKQVDL